MKKYPLISIGILNRNGYERLKKTIPPILKQNYPNYEIIVFDNGSTDKSLDYLKQNKKIKIIQSKENLGYGKAKNNLVNKCRGKYVLMLDNDIQLIKKDTLKNLHRAYLTHKNIAFLSPIVLDVNKKEIQSMGLTYNNIQKEIKLENIYKKGIVQIAGYRGNTVFFKKEIFIKLGGFDEIYPFNIDDYDLSARAYLFGYKNYLDLNEIVKHIGIESRINLDSLAWKEKTHLAGFERMIIKNYKLKNLLIWFPASFIWIMIKNIQKCIKTKSFKPLISFLHSFFMLLRDFPNSLKQRKKIQKIRTTKEDLFLKIKPQITNGKK